MRKKEKFGTGLVRTEEGDVTLMGKLNWQASMVSIPSPHQG